MRVPINFCCLFNSITEFSKKKKLSEDLDETPFLVLTINAGYISPFLTFEEALLFFLKLFTTTKTESPMDPYLFFDALIILIQ